MKECRESASLVQSDQDKFSDAAFYSGMKSKVGIIGVKTAALRLTCTWTG